MVVELKFIEELCRRFFIIHPKNVFKIVEWQIWICRRPWIPLIADAIHIHKILLITDCDASIKANETLLRNQQIGNRTLSDWFFMWEHLDEGSISTQLIVYKYIYIAYTR